MNEEQWLTCTDPTQMLEFLRGKASERKLRLFAVACCWRVWQLLGDVGARDAVEVAEGFADGLVDDQQRSDARKAAQRSAQGRDVIPRPTAPKWERRAASTVYYAAAREAMEAAYNAPQLAIESLVWKAGGYGECDSKAIRRDESSQQVRALRCLFGDLFNPIAIAPAWLAWNDAAIVRMATAMYDQRRFEDMPLLADALEDAGCTDKGVLAHCREPGSVHVRGCWVIDLLLGKS